MTAKEAIVKQMLWGDKPCRHPRIELLNSYEMKDVDCRWVTRTGYYVCPECGKIWNPEEYAEYLKSINP